MVVLHRPGRQGHRLARRRHGGRRRPGQRRHRLLRRVHPHGRLAVGVDHHQRDAHRRRRRHRAGGRRRPARDDREQPRARAVDAPGAEDVAEVVIVRRLGTRPPRGPGTAPWCTAASAPRPPTSRSRPGRASGTPRSRSTTTKRLHAGDGLAAALRPAAVRPSRRRHHRPHGALPLAARVDGLVLQHPDLAWRGVEEGHLDLGRTSRATSCASASLRAATPGTCSPASALARSPATAPSSASAHLRHPLGRLPRGCSLRFA